MLHKNGEKIIIAVLVLVVLVVLFWKNPGVAKSDYSVVYLITGEVYVGKLQTFPSFQLKDGYFLQITQDPKDSTKNNFQLTPMNEALWAPQSLHLLKPNVVFYGKLSPESSIAKTLAEQAK